MLGKIFIFAILFISLGVFIKLRRYGAPKSALLYSLGVPIFILIIGLSYGHKLIKEDKRVREISFLKKVKLHVLFTAKSIRSLPLLTGIACIQFGKRKVGISDILEKVIVSVTKSNTERAFKFFNDNIINYSNETYISKSVL